MPEEQQAPKRRIIVGSEPEQYPGMFRHVDGRYDGYAQHLIQEIAEIVGLELETKSDLFGPLETLLVAGKIDLIPMVPYSPHRDEYMDFSAPHSIIQDAAFVRRGDSSIQTEANLRGKSIIVVESDIAHRHIVSNSISDRVTTVLSFDEALRLLSSGQHDVVLAPRWLGLRIIGSWNLSNLTTAAPTIRGYARSFHFGVAEGDKKLLELLNRGVYIMEESSRDEKIYDAWFGAWDSQ